MAAQCASRALTDTEKRYAQIEKELLAIVFAAKRFHQYVYGRPVTVQSDQKPLEVIVRKPLSKAPARLQGMLLQLQRYDLHITYTPGKHMYIADTLSRATASREGENIDENPCEERVVYALEPTDSLSEGTLSQLEKATAADSVLQAVCEKHKNGWPIKKKSLDRKLHGYWSVREPAVVIRQRDEPPRSYTVQTPAGRTQRRNRRHLRKIHPSLFIDTDRDEQLDSEMQPSQAPVSGLTTTQPSSCDYRQDTHMLHEERQSG